VEIEAFYRQNIRASIAAVVDRQFNTKYEFIKTPATVYGELKNSADQTRWLW
jgi:hypothetical protein